MTFLGIAGYPSAWIEDNASLTGSLRVMVKNTDNSQLHGNLTWTDDGFLAFQTIKRHLQEAPVLALPDYSKNFLLYVSTSTGGNSTPKYLVWGTLSVNRYEDESSTACILFHHLFRS